MRHDVFQKVASFSNGEFDQFSTASLITRTTNDITQIQFLFVMVPRTLLYAPIIGVGGVVMALSKSTSMSWIIAVCVLILVGFIAVIYSIVMPKFKPVQKLVDRLNLVVREHLSGMMVIRAFGTQSYEEDRFEVANRNLTRNYRFVNRVTAFMMPAMMFLMNVMSLVIVWIGGHQIEQATMQVGDMMALCSMPCRLCSLPHRIDDLHHDPACIGIGWPYCRRAGNRASHFGSCKAGGS